ncbi:9842_t:CDS:2 [Funneliformis caledonium]|uniref:9842_t:CDS:1 n=1 Tax=Funneliformis caledonium TaxID=1117310 RepID=A0A9N8V7T9_9GLOM|nr:9842_t:CDS:2 [Funneliformis caledonium]
MLDPILVARFILADHYSDIYISEANFLNSSFRTRKLQQGRLLHLQAAEEKAMVEVYLTEAGEENKTNAYYLVEPVDVL